MLNLINFVKIKLCAPYVTVKIHFVIFCRFFRFFMIRNCILIFNYKLFLTLLYLGTNDTF